VRRAGNCWRNYECLGSLMGELNRVFDFDAVQLARFRKKAFEPIELRAALIQPCLRLLCHELNFDGESLWVALVPGEHVGKHVPAPNPFHLCPQNSKQARRDLNGSCVQCV